MKNLYNNMKNWALNNWMAILNFFIIILSYLIIHYGQQVLFAEAILGSWIFISMGYFFYDTFIKNKKPLN